MIKNTEGNYGIVTKIFHWLLFVMLSFMIFAGNTMSGMPKGAEKLEMAGMHKSFGALVLTLIMLRFIWKLMNTTPKAPKGTQKIQALAAKLMHWGLYVLMFAQPLSGIVMSQAAGYPVSFFGLFEFPMLLDKSESLAHLAHSAHGIIWIMLMVSVLGHAAVGIHHQFIKKDGALKRMSF
ncbi:MAG: cytochrome B [Gammaproteobacteria bacterium]|nr:MAG: cytochrome B [Gammaproteobacteria bacterium]